MVAKMPTVATPIAIYLYEPGAGGLDRVAILLANGMAARGLRVELWLGRSDGALHGLISDAVLIRIVPLPRLRRRGLALFLQIPVIARMIRLYRPAILMSAGNQSNLPLSLAAALSGSAETRVIHKITNPAARPEMGGWTRAVRRARFGITALLAPCTLVLCDADKRAFAASYPRIAERFHTVCNPYVTETMLAIGRSRWGEQPAVPSLLSVGRLVPQKDPFTLLAAMALLAHRPWRLTIVGDGPLRGALQETAEGLGIAERITFAGFIPDVTPFYAKAQLLILSSRWEGLPAGPIEALACGCDVVATDCAPGLTELLAAAGAPAPVPGGDAPALARAIGAALDAGSPSSRARGVANLYSMTASLDDHLRLLS
jgi:glycosyltransferase involved in cell wall biosynthesis